MNAETDIVAEDLSQEDWRKNLAEIGKKKGFFEELGKDHTALYVKGAKGGGDTLIVTFENLDHVYGSGNRMPWGYDFVQKQGWSMLGLMAHDWTWYRDPAVWDFFDGLKKKRFFKKFKKVIFYGASMGGYAASVFSAACPGSTVILISPQATLDREIASWETRYRRAWSRDFSSRYAYGPQMVEKADKVHLFYDPNAPLDAMHAALFMGKNTTRYRCRFMGHRIASLWLLMGVLKPIVLECVDGSMTPGRFYSLLRARREIPRYQKEMIGHLKDHGRTWLVAHYCRAVLARRRAPAFRRELRVAETRLARFAKMKQRAAEKAK